MGEIRHSDFGAHARKIPDLYFANIVKLAQIVRIEADVSLKEPKPKTIEEVLQRVEHETGVEGRRAFEGFLKKMRPDAGGCARRPTLRSLPHSTTYVSGAFSAAAGN